MGIFTFFLQFVLSFVFGQEIYYFNNFFCVCFCLFLFSFFRLSPLREMKNDLNFFRKRKNKKYLYRLLACAYTYRLALFPKNLITHRMFLGEIWSGNTIHEPRMIYLKKILANFSCTFKTEIYDDSYEASSRSIYGTKISTRQNSTPSTIDCDGNGLGFGFINISFIHAILANHTKHPIIWFSADFTSLAR